MSNNSEVGLTPEKLRGLAQQQGLRETTSEPPVYQVHRLSAQLGADQIDDIVRRHEAGESARSLANECSVAPSALIRLLRERNVVVRQHVVTSDQEEMMVRDYEAGMTTAELEQKHQLSHSTVLRALHRAGVEMRAKAPRRKSA
ncbi:hypothetical protein [Rhodoglobus aureus]|uniref:hypothetical protein n=1 Tax=Rhodoglobus aureus TaxID=191497 RepID=UPI0031D671D7